MEKFKTRSAEKAFIIDFSKVTTVEDIVTVLKSMNLIARWNTEEVPEPFKEMAAKGMMIEIFEFKEFVRKDKD